jgi:hypothetical protein
LEVVDRIARSAGAEALVLTGGFAFNHYVEYRPTYDVDAWWAADADASLRATAEQSVASVFTTIAGEHGSSYHVRRGAEMTSFELHDERGKKTFSFQVAERDRQIQPPIESPYPPIRIETVDDLVASKMNALVARGAGRDFQDIAEVCWAGLVTPNTCWQLWQRKNPDKDVFAASAQVSHHLASIELRVPLERMAPGPERDRNAERREFFKTTFRDVAQHLARENDLDR